jgi:hypothetical protein
MPAAVSMMLGREVMEAGFTADGVLAGHCPPARRHATITA